MGAVHHLMVLCYYLQHPALYSRDGLAHGRRLLVDFVDRGVAPDQARHSARKEVDSGSRPWPITARPGNAGAYDRPIAWQLTAADVVAGGREHYRDNVRAWAESIHEQLRQA